MKHINEVVQIPNVDGYTRLTNFILGALLIATVFIVGGGNLGWWVLFPIVAVYPMLVAITGCSLHRVLANMVLRGIREFDAENGKAGSEYYRLVLH